MAEAQAEWHTTRQGDKVRVWRWCDCSEWDAEAPVPPGTRHHREKGPRDSEICYYADHNSRTMTVLRIHDEGHSDA